MNGLRLAQHILQLTRAVCIITVLTEHTGVNANDSLDRNRYGRSGWN